MKFKPTHDSTCNHDYDTPLDMNDSYYAEAMQQKRMIREKMKVTLNKTNDYFFNNKQF